MKQWWRRDKIPDEGFLMTVRLIKRFYWHNNIFTGKVAWNSYLTHRLRHNCVIDQSATENSDPHVDYRFLLTRVEKCENWTRIRESSITTNKNCSNIWIATKQTSNEETVLYDQEYCNTTRMFNGILSLLGWQEDNTSLTICNSVPVHLLFYKLEEL